MPGLGLNPLGLGLNRQASSGASPPTPPPTPANGALDFSYASQSGLLALILEDF